MNFFEDLQHFRDNIKILLEEKMQNISYDFLSKTDIKVGDSLIPFGIEKGNAVSVIVKDYKNNAKVLFENGSDKISVRFVCDTYCKDGTIYRNDEKYCDFTLDASGKWIISDTTFEYIKPK